MKLLIADDEALARRRLIDLLRGVEGLSIVGEAENGLEALAACERWQPDVVLLDIRMPGMDGIKVAERLKGSAHPPAVIFCTAYDEHALAAFDAQALDYLLKPVRRERLIAALERARRMGAPAIEAPALANSARTRVHICARVRGEIKLVPVAAIAYFLADAKYVEVHYDGGQVLIEDSLVSLEEEFGERFVRIHRNCLVARDRLEGLARTQDGETVARLRGVAEPLEVSRRNLPQVRRLLRLI